MSNTPNPILTFAPKIDPEAPPWLHQHLTLIYQKLNNHTQAMKLLGGKGSVTSTIPPVVEGGSFSGGGGSLPTNVIGSVNDQTGVTAYSTQAGDYGAEVVLSDASSIAVTLVTQSPPWFCFFSNLGAGTATLTPQSGTISYGTTAGASSMPLAAGDWAVAAFDGTNWWAMLSQASGGGSGVTSLQGETGALTLTSSGGTVTITTPTSTTINLEATGGGGGGYLKGTVGLSWSAGDPEVSATTTISGAAPNMAAFMGIVGASGSTFPIKQDWCNACVSASNTVDCALIFPTGGAPFSSAGTVIFPVVVFP